MTQVTSQALQKASRRNRRKDESSDDCRKLSETAQTSCGVV